MQTTTGYLSAVPMTKLGQFTAVLYGLVGIPLMFLAAVDIGRFLSDVVLLLYRKVVRSIKIFKLLLKFIKFFISSNFAKLNLNLQTVLSFLAVSVVIVCGSLQYCVMKRKLAKACGCSAKKQLIMEMMDTSGVPHMSKHRSITNIFMDKYKLSGFAMREGICVLEMTYHCCGSFRIR